MHTLEIKGDWSVIKGKLRQQWARTGETREAIEKAVKEFNS